MNESVSDAELAALESYLRRRLHIEVTDLAVLNDGLNLSLAIATPHAEPAYVLRRPNKLRWTELFNSVSQEYQILARMDETAVPAPKPVHHCKDESVIGGEFLVLTYLPGAVLPIGSVLPDGFQYEAGRRRIGHQLIDTLAEIHTTGRTRFEEVCDSYTARDELAHATERLDEATSVTGHEIPRLREVGDWLRANAPEDRALTLIHGDYRPGNVLFDGEETPRLTGVLDWETASFGDPLTELGYLLLRWRDERDSPPALDELADRHPEWDGHEALRAQNEHGMCQFSSAPGSPSRRELVDRYETLTGRPFEHDRYYRAHAAFVLATVWADLHRSRVEAGDESVWEPTIEYMALYAQSIVGGDIPL